MERFSLPILAICFLLAAPLTAQNNNGWNDDAQQCLDKSGDVAIAACSRAISSGQLSQVNLATTYYNRGCEYRNKNEFDAAISDFSEAIQLNPTYVQAYNNRGVSWYDKGEYDRALPDYSKAIELDPKHFNAYYGLGNVYRAKTDYAKAIENYTEALKLSPNFSGAYITRGNTYTEMGAYDMAIADFKDALRTEPTALDPPLLIAVARMHKGDNSIADELGEETKASANSWPTPVVQFYLGKLSVDELMAAAKNSDTEVQQGQFCEMYYYLGEWQLSHNQQVNGIESLQSARANCTQTYFVHDSVIAELKRLDAR